MKANELSCKDLMVWDWVKPKNVDSRFRVGLIGVDSVWNDIDTHEWYYDEIEPIPLTAKILGKNGFEELMNESEVSAARFGRKTEPTGVWQYGFGRFDSVAYVPEQSFLRIKFMEGCQANIANIKYVHELQHALRLCGIEKTIEL